MHTFYIADNKTKQATIYQTEKTREDIWQEVESRVDVVREVETVEQAQNYLVQYGNEYVPYDSFIK